MENPAQTQNRAETEEQPEHPPRPGLKAFAVVGILVSGVSILASIARTKVVARVVGPDGVGISAEVAQLVALATVAAPIAAGPALLSRIANAHRDGDLDRVRRATGAALGLGLTLALAGAAGAVLVAPWVLPRASDFPARLFVTLTAVSAVLGVVGSIAQTLFVGTSNLRGIATVSLVPTLLATGISVGLTLWLALLGQFIGAALGAVITLATNLIYLRRGRGVPRVSLRPRFDLGFAKEAVVMGATALIASFLAQALYTTIRATLELVGGHANGARYNGNYQAAFAIGGTYFATFLGSVASYFSPRFAAARSSAELTDAVREAERFVLRVGPPAVFLAIAFRRDVIHLLYSDRFDIASSILGYQLSGDVVKAVAWASAAPLFYRNQVRAYLVSELAPILAGITANVILIRQFGPIGTGLAYMISYSVHLLVSVFVLRSSSRVPVARGTVVLTLATTLACVGLNLLTGAVPASRWLVIPGALVWMACTGTLLPFIAKIRARLARLTALIR